MANVDGKWKTIVDSPMGAQAGVLTLDASGDTLTGTWTEQGNEVAIQDGKVDGDALSWKVNVSIPFPMTLDCSATVSGDDMTGTVKVGNFGSFAMTGTRE